MAHIKTKLFFFYRKFHKLVFIVNLISLVRIVVISWSHVNVQSQNQRCNICVFANIIVIQWPVTNQCRQTREILLNPDKQRIMCSVIFLLSCTGSLICTNIIIYLNLLTLDQSMLSTDKSNISPVLAKQRVSNSILTTNSRS